MLKLAMPLGAAVAFVASAHAQTFFPPPPTPAGNPTTPQKALLGKALFWDEQMSSSRTMACGTCHIFGHGGTDTRAAGATHPGPDGTFGTPDDIHGSFGVVRQDVAGANVGAPLFGVRPQSTGRRSPSAINAAYESVLFWDGRALNAFTDPVSGLVTLPQDAALESQAAGPPVSDVEMSHIGRSWTDIATDIAPLQPLALADQIPANLAAFTANQTYATLFQSVYGSPGVTPERIIFAIAAYERTLIADQSPLDYYLQGVGSLSPAANAGLGVFFNLCSTCHTEVLIQSGAPNDFRNIGVRPAADDFGRFNVTGNNADKGRFKVPGLRNVALRAPYMHTGAFPTLNAVVQFYNRGGDFGPSIDPLVSFITGLITPTDEANLVAFMNTLTDPRVQLQQPPFDRPRLWSESPRAPTTFGYGTIGSGGVAPITVAAAPPYLGNSKFTIGLDTTLPGVPSLLVVDFAAQNPPTTMFGQNIYLGLVAPRWYGTPTTQGPGPGQGFSYVPVPIPSTPNIVGIQFFGQWLVGDPAGPFGMTTSNAFAATIF
jgi:cytochrome c peroxidase